MRAGWREESSDSNLRGAECVANYGAIAHSLVDDIPPLRLDFKQNPEDTDAEAPERKFYRPSAARVLETIRGKVDAVSRALLQPSSEGEAASAAFPTLVRQLARDGIDLDHLRKSKNDERVAKQAAERIAIQVVGQWLPAVVIQTVVESYE